MNWQVQELDGTALCDHPTFDEAEECRLEMIAHLHRPFRIRRTA